MSVGNLFWEGLMNGATKNITKRGKKEKEMNGGILTGRFHCLCHRFPQRNSKTYVRGGRGSERERKERG